MLSIAEVVGDFSFENYANTSNNISFLGGMAGYAGVIFFLIKSLKQTNILTVNLLWDGLSTLVETLAAIIILGETFNNITQWLGAVLIISGIVLIKFK